MKNRIKNLGNTFFKKNEKSVLSSILPGGNNWKKFIAKGGDCKKNCPACCLSGNGTGKLCTQKWEQAPLKRKTLETLTHIFENFEHYNQGDLNPTKKSTIVSVIKMRKKCSQLLVDLIINDIEENKYTEKKIRSNHNEFRRQLLDYWGCCSVTKIRDETLLSATHIKPWCKCNSYEKFDLYNGLLLISPLDYLFDNGFISFFDTGRIIISNTIKACCSYFAIHDFMHLTKIEDKHKKYLRYHREFWKLNDE